MMLRTETAEYEVVGQQNNHLWLEVLGEVDRGIRVSVPVRDADYDEDTQESVEQLTVGSIVQAKLVSETESRPNWKIESVDVLREARSRNRANASADRSDRHRLPAPDGNV